jgi:hypothetical protein
MSKYNVDPLFPTELKTYSLKDRDSKVDVGQFACAWEAGGSFPDFIDSLPRILGGNDLRSLIQAWAAAREQKRGMILGMGAHPIKLGLNPVIIDLMERGWISALALNGAGIIHDFEVAYAGATSEDVAEQIRGGQFGMARETGELLNEAMDAALELDLGMGEAVGRMLAGSEFPHLDLSLLASAYRLGIPVTVHVALGTDTIHFHPRVSGEALGRASLRDFFLFCRIVQDLDGGGIYLNAGSAVILPEVFLKAVTYVRNRGFQLKDFTTAVCDFIRHYRPEQNVVLRPLQGKCRGYYFVGQHELFIPLLAAALKTAASTA